MAEYEFKPGNIEDAINKNGETFSKPINILPTEEEKEQIAADVQQEQEENYAKLDAIMASGQPVRRKMPDLLTIPKIYGNSLSMPEATRSWDDLGIGEKMLYGTQEKLWDVYRNVTNDQAHILSDARRYAPSIGVTPQYLVDNPDEMERARLEYDRKQKLGFMPVDENYSSGMLDANYPELKDIRLSDPVGAAQALQNYQDVHGMRNIFDSIHDTIFGVKELLLDAYNSGSDMVKLYDAQMKAVKTGDVEAARSEVDEITQRLKEYHDQDEPTTPLGKVVYDTIQQLTIYGTQGLRALQYVPKGMAMAMAAAAPAAAAAGPETLGAGTAAILTGAGITGAAWGFRTGMFKEIQNQSMAERYWQMANAKDKNGKPMYSRNNMLLDSIGTGTINGAIELGLLELGYKPIKAAWGKDAAKAILTNGAAQRDIAEAGKGAITRIALTQGALQYARGVASELAEEGAQSMVGSMAENIEYGIHGQGKWNTVGDVLNDAIDSMVQAVPAALGMGGMGAAVHTAGNYKAMNNIASIKLNEWKEEYKRNVEKQTIDQLIAQKKENNLAKEAPDVYQKVVDAQAKQVGMDTMYVDAQELARTEEGVNVLNDMVNKGIVSGEQVDNAVSNGTDLEIKTGVFAQLADETTDTKTLMDATTMNKGGIHMAALRERAKRIEAMRQELSQLANDKSDRLAEEIVQEHFKDADEPTQEAARDVVYRNPYDIEKSYKDAVKEARTEYENAVNYTYYSTYKPQGVSVITADANGYNNTQTGRGYRMSNNEPWYSDMYKEYGGKATKEQLLDVAYKNERKEIAASSPELLQEWENNVAEKKARYETLKGMADQFTTLAKSDYALRNTFTKDGASVYTQALHTLSNASEQASQAAKENAFIYARMAERWTNIMNEYGDTAYTPQKFMEQHPIVIGNKKAGTYGQPITNMDIQLDKPAPVITIQEKYAGMDWKDLRKQLPGTVENDIVSKINEKGEYIPYVNEATKNKVIVTKKGSLSHFKSDKTSSPDSTKKRQNTLHYEMIEAVPEIIKRGIWIEDHIDRHQKAIYVSRIIAPVQIGAHIYAVKLTVKKDENKYLLESGEYTHFRAYDIETEEEPKSGSTSTNSDARPDHQQPIPLLSSSNLSIRELLKNVNDGLKHGPYVNNDGTPNYGIYFGDNETGGVMYITPKDTTYEQRAWHGSPYNFDTFDLGAMGKGEGNQAHGWGLYFAKDRNVSEDYKDVLGDKNNSIEVNHIAYRLNEDGDWVGNGIVIEYGSSMGYVLDSMYEMGSREKAIADLEDAVKKNRIRGVYADEARKAVEILKEGHIKLTKNDRLYEVEIPENDVLLDEQKTIGEQPQKVQDAIMDMLFGTNVNAALREAEKKGGAEGKFAVEKALRYISEDESELEARGISAEEVEHAYNKALEYVDEELLLKAQEEKLSYEDPEKPHLEEGRKLEYKVKELTGEEFYNELAMSTPGYDEAASKLLNEYGIKGITYEGERDGRCYVVFDDKAISIIDKYNQKLNGIKAAYDANTGAIHLFDAADQSSFIHEAGHMWLSEMKNMAMQDGAPEQLIKDLDVLTAWGTYSPEKMNDYAGTNREKEFAEYAKAIEDARKSGDAIAIKAAEERWMQERFARAFERYIADGKAPVRELQGPFRKFKKWLVGIYQDLKNLGKEPPEDVKRVMDRMLATDEEIETWAKLREINAWDRKGFSGDLSGSEGNMIKKWAEKIRETAKEKLMQKYMEDIKKQDEADRQRGLEEEKIAYQKQLCEENELYKYENLYNTMPEARAGILAKLNIADEKEFRKALQEAGGTLEERTHEYMKAKQEEYDSLMYSPEQIRTMADEQLASTNGQIALNELEAHAMRRKLNGYIAECVKAMREVGNVSGTDAEVAAQLRNILHVEDIADKEKAAKGAMKDSILAKSKEIADLKKRLAETKEKGKETKEQNERTIAQLKAGLNEVIKGLNDARDMGSSNYQSVLRLTREEINDMTISDATTWRHYEIKAKSASRRADVQMSAGNFTEAIIEKNNAQKFYCMSRVAKENEDFLRKALGHDYEDAATGEERTGIAGIINRIKRQKNPVRMGPNERYFIEHLAYILGLDNRDGRMPLDDKGNPIGINWEYLYRDLSPDNATEQKSKLNPDDLIAPWVRAMVERKDRIEDYQKNITMAQMKDIYQAIQAIYRVGKRDYEATTLMNDGKTVSIIDAVTEMLAERDYSVDTIEQKLWSAEQKENDKTATGRLKDTLSDALLSLTKPEIVLNDMGKSFIKYIYKPIDTASRNEMSMLQQAYKEFGEIYNMYSKTEWRHIRQDKLYNLGRISNYTKEQVLAIALNWGNKEGRQRILDNLNEGIQHEYEKYTQTDVENLFAKVFTEKDLDFLEAVWKQIDQYWPERNKVQERLYGVGLGRVQATPYTINGRKVSGGYYPIVYDPKISTRTTDMELDDIVKSQLSGNAAMSIGMGSTKKRVKVVKGQVVMKSLNIWPQAVNEAIHHICMREAVTDVYKLLNRKEMEAVIVQDYGIETYQMLKQWARDCWKTDIAKTDKISRMLETLRRNTSYSVMAYRASTAILNGLNIFPMMREIGFANTWRALKDVYITGNYKKSRQFVMNHSPFMAERINTLDKDFQQHMTFDVDKNASILSVKSNGVGNKVQYIGGIKDGINRFAYLAIAETDLMLSMPLWKWQYEESLRRQIEEGKTDELVMRDQATFEADRAVRNVLGSGMTKDQAQVQRTQGLVSQIIPFYSYCSTVMNALIKEGYNISAGKSKVGMWNAMLYWIVLPAIFEQLFRSAVAGDDWETLIKKMGVKMITNTTQGVPVVRDAVEFAANAAFDLPNYDSGNVLAISIIDELQKGIQSAGSKKQDATDVGIHLTRALNRYTGFSDTLTDGFWSLMRFSLIDTDRSILDLVNSVIFDRRYKIAKEREKEEKQKEKKNTKQKDDKK